MSSHTFLAERDNLPLALDWNSGQGVSSVGRGRGALLRLQVDNSDTGNRACHLVDYCTGDAAFPDNAVTRQFLILRTGLTYGCQPIMANSPMDLSRFLILIIDNDECLYMDNFLFFRLAQIHGIN